MVPAATTELAGRIASQEGLRGNGPWPVQPGWSELFGQPFTGDTYAEVAAEVGLEAQPFEPPPQVNPAVHDLAVQLGLVT